MSATNNAILMYLIVRKDLLSYTRGALMAQACHASTATMWKYREDEHVRNYMQDMDNMKKVVLQVDDEISLKDVSGVLALNNIEHKLWIEQPENEATCIAVKPYPKQIVFPYLKKLKLFS